MGADVFDLQTFIDAIPFYVMLIDADHHIIMTNQAIKKALGIAQPDQIVGGYCPKVVHGLDEPYPGCPLEEAIETGRDVEREFFDPITNRWVNSAIYATGRQTGHGKEIYLHFIVDITHRKLAEKEIEAKTRSLEEMNTALRVLLRKREEDKAELGENVLANVESLINVYLEKLQGSGLTKRQAGYLDVIRANLNQVISPFTSNLTLRQYHLTPVEIQVADLIGQGQTSKEMAAILNLSARTIDFHRHNIRRKLKIANKKANLRSILMSLR